MKMAKLVVPLNGTYSTTGDSGEGCDGTKRNDGIMRLNGETTISVIIPPLDSCTVSLQVSNDPDASSPTWLTLQKADWSADLATGTITTTGKAIAYFPVPFKAVRPICSQAQTSLARTFILVAV